MAELYLDKLTKRFGPVLALDELSLRVEDGELLVLVGPSGCGKTTALRLIAGLESPAAGSIRIGDRSVVDLSPRERDVAMVFQDFALYPHWDVFGNLSFGLRMRGVARAEIERRVRETAQLLGIEPLLSRRPAALSGGQQQRVALGRALVRRPAVFLLDEPFSGLDAPLRDGLRRELAVLQQRLGTTALHVTHDQAEALQLGHRIAVLHQGRVQQIGTPLEVYQRPANRQVAEFIGSPPMNFFPARLTARGGAPIIDAADFQLPLAAFPGLEGTPAEVTLGIRAEHIRICSEAEPPAGSWQAQVVLIRPLGAFTLLELKSPTHAFTVRVSADAPHHLGQHLTLTADPQHCHLFAADTGQALATLPVAKYVKPSRP